MLTDGVCSLCSGQKLQNVNVPDKWLNVEAVVCLHMCPSGLVLAPLTLQSLITELFSRCSIRSADIPLTSESLPQ